MRRGISGAVAASAVMLIGAPSASAATQIGEVFDPEDCTNGITVLQTTSPGGSYTVPSAGVITSWRIQTDATPPGGINFKVARPAGGNDFTILAESAATTPMPAMTNTYAIQVPVQSGDVIGLWSGSGGNYCRGALGYDVHLFSGNVPPGTTETFIPVASTQLDLSAMLEPDTDCDGFGDETQDPSVTPPGDCPQAQPEPEPQPQTKADGTLTIDANKGKVEKGRKVTLTGQLDVAANEACEPNRAIQIQRRLKSEDDSKFATFETVQTDATGNYSLKVKVKKTYFYRAVVPETDVCDDETSNSQKVRAQKKKAAQEA
jgi:hypothetical protein